MNSVLVDAENPSKISLQIKTFPKVQSKLKSKQKSNYFEENIYDIFSLPEWLFSLLKSHKYIHNNFKLIIGRF